jgi:hypothetical protein
MSTRASQAQLIEHYGDPRKAKARKAIRPIRLPRRDVLIGEMIATQCHDSIAAKFVDAYWQTCRLLDEWPTEVQAYNVRKVAGTDKWSLHSWALAWDVFLEGSLYRDPKTGRDIPSPAWFNGMQQRGFFAGQNFKHPDLHHLEFPWKSW